MNDPKRVLVERAVAAATKARPILEARAKALAALVAPTDAALAAARKWLADGDVTAPATASAAAAPAIERAWLRWDESAELTRGLVALKRATHAAEAAMLAARAAAWTPERSIGTGRDDAEGAVGPLWEATEAERCAAMALGTA